MSDKPCEVTWIDSDTGEVKSRPYVGRDPVIWSPSAPSNPTGEPQFRGEFDEWEKTALEMALDLVPDLEAICDRAKAEYKSVEVRVHVA